MPTKHFCLTEKERRDFARLGYLTIPDALSSDQVSRLTAAIDRRAEARRDPAIPEVNTADILGLDPAFLDLIDRPKVFHKIWGLLGWNIWVQHSHFNVMPPLARAGDAAAASFNYHWHRDGGAINSDLKLRPAPLLLVKVGFYLTDVARDGGPTYFIGGTRSDKIPSGTTLPRNAYPLEVKAGTAVIFGNKVIHSLRSPNRSSAVRKSVFIQYGYRWIQGLDRNSPPRSSENLGEVRKQLLGLTCTFTRDGRAEGRSGRFYPNDEDVPLRQHIAELLGPEADKFVKRSVQPSEVRPYA